jgi:hypothetical protein
LYRADEAVNALILAFDGPNFLAISGTLRARLNAVFLGHRAKKLARTLDGFLSDKNFGDRFAGSGSRLRNGKNKGSVN